MPDAVSQLDPIVVEPLLHNGIVRLALKAYASLGPLLASEMNQQAVFFPACEHNMSMLGESVFDIGDRLLNGLRRHLGNPADRKVGVEIKGSALQ